MRRFRLILIAAVLGHLAAAGPAGAWRQPDAKLALHIQPHVGKTILTCVPAERGGYAPTDLPCSQMTMNGELRTTYDVYLVAGRAAPGVGLAGAQCGVEYDARPGVGIDMFGWTRCADVEFFGKGPDGSWPAAGSGLISVWILPDNCRTTPIPGAEGEGVHGVLGAFYLYAYSEDVLQIGADRSRSVGSPFAIGDCGAIVTELQESAMPRATFGEADEKPCNPCEEPCAEDPGCFLSVDELDFGRVELGSYAERGLYLQNPGPGRMRALVQVPPNRDFRPVRGYGQVELDPGEKHEIVVRFAPQSVRKMSLVLHTSTTCPPVLLRGEGVLPATGAAGEIVFETRPGDRRQRVRFSLPHEGMLAADLFDLRGRLVRTLAVEDRGAGPQDLSWDAEDLPSGVYFLRLSGAGWERAAKVTILR